jgi:serpin B
MDRRTFLTAVIAGPALVALLEACGSDASKSSPTSPSDPTSPSSDETSTSTASTSTASTAVSTSTPDPDNAGVARSGKSRVAATAGDAAQAVKVVNDFGVSMYHRLAPPIDAGAGGRTNLVFSPASIALALAMTRAGAVGTTGTEMDTVLHVSDPATLARSMNALTTELAARTKTVAIPGAEAANVELDIANSLWAQKDLSFETAFLDLLATEYGAGLQLVDYKADPDGSRVLINAWVDDATKDRIPELLARGTITADTRLTIVNAIYMKAPWQDAFVKDFTAPAAFTTSTGSSVQAPMMSQQKYFDYASTNGWQAVVLPYLGGDLSMVIVLPDEGAPLDATVDALAGLDAQLGPQLVSLTMPKFDIETATGLAELLAAMGMPTAFDRSAADFSGMTKDEKLFISAVVHQANITVDEDGTEAAAATAVIAATTAAPAENPIQFTVDRPFLFTIRDNATGAILFLGHIGDPTS